MLQQDEPETWAKDRGNQQGQHGTQGRIPGSRHPALVSFSSVRTSSQTSPTPLPRRKRPPVPPTRATSVVWASH